MPAKTTLPTTFNAPLYFKKEKGRLEALVDGIFAIAMTLLILSLEIPDIDGPVTANILKDTLSNLAPSFYNFLLSFLILAVFWNVHKKQFSRARSVDSAITWINIFILLAVVLMPFLTEMLTKFDSISLAAFLFNLDMLVISALFFFQWRYLAKKNHLAKNFSSKKATFKNAVFLLASFIAIILSFLAPSWSTLAYLGIPLTFQILERKA